MKSLLTYTPKLSPQNQGWLVILFGFFGFILWASLYPIDQGIPGSGFLIPKTEKLVFTAPSTSFVSLVPKHVGEHVEKGELIVELDTVPMMINLKRLEESHEGLMTAINALKMALNARNQQVAALKAQYAEINRIVEDGFQNQKKALLAKSEHVKMVESQYQSNKKLFEAGFLSRNALEKSKSELAWAQSESFDLGAKNEQIETNTKQNLSAVNTQLALAVSESLELKSNLDQNLSRLKEIEQQINAAKHDILLSKIISPVSGTIMNLSIKTPGVNVTVGQPLFEIVPDSDELVVEVRIPVNYADRLKTGMSVDVMFPTLSGSQTKRVKGRLDYLSGDKITDPRSNQIFLEARVSLTEFSNTLRDSLRAGLPASIIINSGSRTLMSYILRPFNDRLAMGLQ